MKFVFKRKYPDHPDQAAISRGFTLTAALTSNDHPDRRGL